MNEEPEEQEYIIMTRNRHLVVGLVFIAMLSILVLGYTEPLSSVYIVILCAILSLVGFFNLGKYITK